MLQIGDVLLGEKQNWSVQRVFAVATMVAWQKLPAQHLAECRWALGAPYACVLCQTLKCNSETSGTSGRCPVICLGTPATQQGRKLIL